MATYNPAQHPQNQGWHPSPAHYEDPQGRFNNEANMMVAESQPFEDVYHKEPQQEPYQPPKILLKHMSMALRLTSEWNRRLLVGVNRFKFWKKLQPKESPEKLDASEMPYGTSPVNVHPSRPWHPPIPVAFSDDDDEHLTLFHAKTPRKEPSNTQKAEQRGVARWGPELLPYLEHVVELLDISDGVEIPLAMIYMDRSCSVETQRSNGIMACPFCSPRTVHRLSLASLLLATQAVKGLSDEEMVHQYDKVSSLGIPVSQLEQMVDWMRGALGDAALMVTVEQMKDWGEYWDSIFYPKQARQKYLERDQARK